MTASKQFWVTIVFAIGVDYLLAKLIAGEGGDVFEVFLILMAGPALFALKAGLVRYAIWKLVGSTSGVEHYRNLMIGNKWPKPDDDESAMTYLQRIVRSSEVEEKSKIVAAQLMGAMQSLFDSRQVLSAWIETSTFKSAMKKYFNAKY